MVALWVATRSDDELTSGAAKVATCWERAGVALRARARKRRFM